MTHTRAKALIPTKVEPMSIEGIASTPPNLKDLTTPSPTAQPAPTGSSPASSEKTGNSAVTVSLSPQATGNVDPNKKVNSDGTIGPHHKPRHPRLPGSFHV
jgi:hypothetical protein